MARPEAAAQTMIDFRTLGTIELLRPDGTRALSVDSKSKALGLLAFLALSTRDGTRRRDELCALFWPDSDEARARNSLNQLLHRVRSSLGGDVILGGRETVGVDPKRIRCDAADFRRAIASGDWSEALELYTGDLLPGLHIEGAGEFERWLEEERQDLRRTAFNAARRLARESGGDDRAAIEALRRARKIRPEDDETVRDLMVACQRQGNTAAAVQEYDTYGAWLAENFDLEPPEETRRLVDELRAGNGSGSRPQILRSIDDWNRVEVRGQTPPRTGEAGPGRPLVAVSAVAAVTLATVLFVTGGLNIMGGGGSGAEGVEIDPYRVAVLPLRTADATDRAAAVVLSDGLDGWAQLRQVEPNRIDAKIGDQEVSAVSPERGSALAAEMGARRFVLVRSQEDGPELNVRAVLYEAGDTLRRMSLVDTTGAASEFSDDWHIDVLLRLFKDQDLGTASDLREAEWIAAPRAMFPYFSALARYSHGEADSAMSYLQQAVEVDTTFGAAWDLLAGLAGNAVHAPGDRDRDSLRALRETAKAFARNYLSESEPSVMGLARARRIAELNPDSAALQAAVGGLYGNAGLAQGFDSDSALPYWRRAYELEPEPGALWQLLLVHLEHGRLSEAESLIHQASNEGLFVPFGVHLRPFLAVIGASTQDVRDSVLYAMEALPHVSNYAVPKTLMIQDSISVPRHVLETIGGGPYLLPTLELTAGRGSAMYGMDAEGPWRIQLWALANSPGLLDEPLDVVSAVRDSVVVLGIPKSPPRGYYSHWTWQMLRFWMLGMLSVRLEEFDQAEMWVDSMTQLAADSIPPDAHPFFVDLGQDMPVEVNAASAAAQGHQEEALALLESVHTGHGRLDNTERMGQPDTDQFVAMRRPFTRLMRGRLLLELGRYEEAEGWFATFPIFITPNDELVFLAPAFRGRAQALDSLGRHEEALHYYRRFALRWKDADPHLQHQVEEARNRIREIEADLKSGSR